MAQTEFELIHQFFTQPQSVLRDDVTLSIGDDCALLSVPEEMSLAVTTDTMVENSHFYPDISPYDLGYKAIATNLSDLAAMGATPAWVSLALTLPKVDNAWLQEFSRGLFELLKEHNIALIGGDTTRGERISVTVTAQGFVPKQTALCRHQAKVGDLIYVSGTIGDALAGFYLLSDLQKNGKSAVNFEREFLLRRHLRPTPRIALGKTLAKRQISRCALDLSDGLIGDLGHILKRSGKSAVINLDVLPCSAELVQLYGREQAEKLALQGGEDYELCFTVSPENQVLLEKYQAELGVNVTCIGQITEPQSQPIMFQRNGNPVELQLQSFEHFNND